jgi:hypothetical protein
MAESRGIREGGWRTLKRGALLAFVVLVGTALGASQLFAAPTSTPNDFKQCAQNEGSGPVTGLGNCHWINSILQSNNSVYTEGMGVPERTLIFSIAATQGNVHTFVFSHQSTKGSAPLHAYDFLESYNQAVADAAAVGITLSLNPCGVEIGPPASLATTCTSLRAGANHSVVDIPDDTYVSVDGPTLSRIQAYEAQRGNRTIDLYGDAPISGASLSFVHMCGVNPCASGGDNQDSDVVYTLTYTSTSSSILVEMAGHLAITCPTAGTSCSSNPVAWVNPKGSANINGGPYHFHYLDFDGTGGSQDNQIQGAQIIPSPQISTQCFAKGLPCNGGTITGGAPVVSDTVTITGTSAAVTGTVTFWLCHSATFNNANVADCSGGAPLTGPILVTQGTSGGLPIATANSANFQTSQVGAYCFLVKFVTADPLHYGNVNDFDNSATSRECFQVTNPTAVSVSTINAESTDGGVTIAVIALGGAGLVVLGGLVFAAARKR